MFKLPTRAILAGFYAELHTKISPILRAELEPADPSASHCGLSFKQRQQKTRCSFVTLAIATSGEGAGRQLGPQKSETTKSHQKSIHQSPQLTAENCHPPSNLQHPSLPSSPLLPPCGPVQRQGQTLRAELGPEARLQHAALLLLERKGTG